NASIDANVCTQDIQAEGEKAYSTSKVGEWLTEYIRKA
ncbi:3-isopropylmalate dehydrogenase, partial [termite gut metagenome]